MCLLGRAGVMHTEDMEQLCVSSTTSSSDMSFIVPVHLSGVEKPVNALIDSGATSNFIDSSLASLPNFKLSSLTGLLFLFLSGPVQDQHFPL